MWWSVSREKNSKKKKNQDFEQVRPKRYRLELVILIKNTDEKMIMRTEVVTVTFNKVSSV